MNVLIATPTYGRLLRPKTRAAIEAQQFAGTSEWRVYRHNPYPAPSMRNVLAQYQDIRDVFLAGPWDALLTVEHDMIPPVNALQMLWDADKPVVYGVYLLRHGVKVLNAYEYIGNGAMGESWSLRRDKQTYTGLARVSGVGFGCTLIRRNVIEAIPFRAGNAESEAWTPDVPFAMDCVRAGIEQWAHFDVLCGHWEDGAIIMPFVDDSTALRTVIMRQTMNVSVAGSSVKLQQGKSYKLPADVGLDLIRAGYAHGTAGNRDASLQTPADAPAQPAKLRKTKRPRLPANAAA